MQSAPLNLLKLLVCLQVSYLLLENASCLIKDSLKVYSKP